jgi:hypothetical protein
MFMSRILIIADFDTLAELAASFAGSSVLLIFEYVWIN